MIKVNKNGNVIKKSSIVNDRNNVRFLKLGDYYDICRSPCN